MPRESASNWDEGRGVPVVKKAGRVREGKRRIKGDRSCWGADEEEQTRSLREGQSGVGGLGGG
jgi:hypothetical protein